MAGGARFEIVVPEGKFPRASRLWILRFDWCRRASMDPLVLLRITPSVSPRCSIAERD
jgi:hypothetical protein